MAKISPKIRLYDEEKIKKLNPETMKLWEKYKIDMELRELSPKTQDGYYNDLLGWWIYILDYQNNRSVTELDEDDLTSFFYFCKKSGNNSRRMKRRMSSISAFYKYLRKKKIITENPMEFIDRPTKDTDIAVQTFLTMDQVDLMRDKLNAQVSAAATDYQKNVWMTLRCYAFFSLSTMARVNAVSSIRWEQIDFESRIVSDVVEKEGYIVDLYFSEEVKGYLIELRKYREDCSMDDSGYVFSTGIGSGAPQISTMNQWCKRIGNLIGVPTLHPHDFRHSGSQLMLLAGASVEEISTQLNHKGLDVTKKHYLRIDKNKVRESHDKYCV